MTQASNGYRVVDSVMATMPSWEQHAVVWCQGIVSARILADSLNLSGEGDYIVLDSLGRVV